MHDPNAAPLNPLPAVVWCLALPIIAVEVALSLGQAGLAGGAEAIGWRVSAIQDYGFWPELMRAMIERSEYPARHLARLVTYPFVHGSIGHALFVVVILLALGKMVGELFRWWAVVLVFFVAAWAGAAAYTLAPGIETPLFGGYAAVYGLIGAFTYLLWMRLGDAGSSRYRAFSMIALLLGVQLVFGAVFGGGWEWLADLAGFASGFLLSFVVSPGGWQRLRALMRQR